MNAPPVPPRPSSADPWAPQRPSDGRPPVPPLPPNYKPDPPAQYGYNSGPSLASPRPQRMNASVPADMARNLENQLAPSFPNAMPAGPGARPMSWANNGPPAPYNNDPYRQGFSPAPYYPNSYPQQPPGWNQGPPPQSLLSPIAPSGWNPSLDPAGGFRSPSPQPPLQQWQQPPPLPPHGLHSLVTSPPPPPAWSQSAPASSLPSPAVPRPPLPQQPSRPFSTFNQAFADLSFSAPPLSPTSERRNLPVPPPAADPPSNEPPAVVITLPTVVTLTGSSQSVSTSSDPARKIAWAKQVLQLVDRTQAGSEDKDDKISDPELVRLTDTAIQHIINICGLAGASPGAQPAFVAEALYLRGTLESSGSFPAYFAKDPRNAFKDFEQSARLGYQSAWFKLGRDYESVNDLARAKDCFERGAAFDEKSCLYRLGMANLLGQLKMTKNPAAAIPLLRKAADLADLDVPQPAYVFGMLLLGEFDQVDIPMSFLLSTLPIATAENPDPRQTEARRRIERAAYFNFAPAQYKLGLAYENATMGCPYDPLLSVQYYSLASQQGEVEADMALSKWFLCGSPGSFDKDELLAVTFAEKAAKKGLPSAEFAMGYYREVGVGGPKDIAIAQKWYQRAAQHNNADAAERLKALAQPTPASLSRAEHEKLTDATLVRKHTSARDRSVAKGQGTGERKGAGDELKQVRKMAEQANLSGHDDLDAIPPVPPMPSAARGGGRGRGARQSSAEFGPGQLPLPGPAAPARGGKFGGGRGDGGGDRFGRNPQRGKEQSPPRAAQRPQSQGREPSSSPPKRERLPSMPTGQGRGVSLSDTGSTNTGLTPGRGAGVSGSLGVARGRGQGGGPPGRRAASGGANDTAPAPAPAPVPSRGEAGGPARGAKKGPATFAEMGFQSKPAEDKDCVIM